MNKNLSTLKHPLEAVRNQNKCFFSVVIPTLNEAQFLPRLLKDLARQKEKEFEVIVVDGGSEDATLKHAAEYIPKLNLKIINSEKKNVSYQRNLGASQAQGKYLVFFDADVQIPPQFLQRIHAFLHKTPYPYLTTDVVADSDHVYDATIVRMHNLMLDIAMMVERPFVGGYDFIVLRQVYYELGGFREEVVHAEDMDLANRLHNAGYRLALLKNPKLKFSLRRYRQDGRLRTLRKNAQAAVHVVTQGPITKDLFSYPMGGRHYAQFKKNSSPLSKTAIIFLEKQLKRMISKLT